MRDRDRPEEVMAEEDITLSLPRRLGLSDVVRMQISRFEEEVRLKKPQFAANVEDLFRLVIKRPDADEIFLEAGQRVAQRYWKERVRVQSTRFPRPIALFRAQRAGRRMFSELVGPTRVRITRKPITLKVERSLSARADPGGAACAFYSGAFGQLLELFTEGRYRVSHPVCAARNAEGGPCEWRADALP